ncbi:MAG: ABC transporter ATP-binding protein [Oscillospiraceae bacterium]|nr:ABC transporter ATP-binding protein [Oscillospiraceae bacterium]
MLDVKDLVVCFRSKEGIHEVVHGISFSMEDGEILGLVGESGSGKTQTVLAIAGLSPINAVIGGTITLNGQELSLLSRHEMRTVQGRDISMVFQEPMTSLNPTMRIGRQVEEALRIHTKLSPEERKAKALQTLADVELPNPEAVYNKYPHELSGGQRQRVMIAAAIICDPKLLIADEPTTALDVTIQAQILKLLKKLNKTMHMSILFISHDLGIIRRLCDNVMVLKSGDIVERGSVDQIFNNPTEEYTKRLIAAIPSRKRGITTDEHRSYYEYFGFLEYDDSDDELEGPF